MEILAIGTRIRFAVNGQEVRFRGLVLVENPQEALVKAAPTPAQ